ncbi:(2,3-dihydroxybenzoyl)adenylate synthase [Microbacterium sp. No. 7]|uniref:(2,3-dihydroxybenzoyl)adenylate synthase n=1 Tax=Microbacterium sp. No. 7 TaxID=1714373 RepID=UPI0018D10B56|nr:AMP-binding protein [Microbacterium sp. No. 7]
MRSAIADVRGWPQEFRERYRARGHWTDETFASFVEDRTARFAPRVAVVGVDAYGTEQSWTYAELGSRARAAACRFAGLGVAPGDRVVVALPNVVEYLEALLGLFRLGAVPVFALPSHREVELTQFCALADAAALVVSAGADRVDHAALYADVSDRLRAEGVRPPQLVDVNLWRQNPWTAAPSTVPLPTAHAEQIAFLQLSGGTTGVSKLIPRTHADYLYSVRASAEICGLDESTRMLVALPAAHNFPMSSPGILGVLHTGGTVVLASDPSPRTAFRLIERHRVTTAALVPPLAQAWIAAARRRAPRLESLTTLQVGGARLADTVAAEIGEVLGARLQQVFGMAEGLVNYTRADDPDELVVSTQGRPISPDDEIRVVDENDVDVAPGEEGSLLTRGPYTIRGYYRSPRADADSFTDDGFYRTGDRVRRLPSGHLVVTGRDSDQVNRGGEKVSVDELENVVLTHPDVRDAVVVGVPDAYLGERVVLVAQTERAADRPDLAGFLRDAGLAAYKIPDSVVFLDELPVTHVGKNSRRELRRLLSQNLRKDVPA